MAEKFEIYKDKAGEFRFRLKAAHGQNILASEAYKKKASVAKTSRDALIDDQTV
ncbi:MAG TPA: DUF1508 domain-containing protein [Wenzhouxiangellaceae bacterium]|nr:DUF1508 domain-containing protein [Wenzhouxiangellaceae bacterium]